MLLLFLLSPAQNYHSFFRSLSHFFCIWKKGVQLIITFINRFSACLPVFYFQMKNTQNAIESPTQRFQSQWYIRRTKSLLFLFEFFNFEFWFFFSLEFLFLEFSIWHTHRIDSVELKCCHYYSWLMPPLKRQETYWHEAQMKMLKKITHWDLNVLVIISFVCLFVSLLFFVFCSFSRSLSKV